MAPTVVDQRGTIQKGRNTWSIQNALVEEVFTANGRTGHIVVSYAVRQRHMTSIELLRLNVGRNTAVKNQFGQPVSLLDIQRGMWVNATFSPMWTRSIPPQTNAFQIVVRQRRQEKPWPPQNTTVNRLLGVDAANNSILTGSLPNVGSLRQFNVSNETVIIGRSGNRIRLCDLRPGQVVEVTHAGFFTASIPPQSPAFRIRVL